MIERAIARPISFYLFLCSAQSRFPMDNGQDTATCYLNWQKRLYVVSSNACVFVPFFRCSIRFQSRFKRTTFHTHQKENGKQFIKRRHSAHIYSICMVFFFFCFLQKKTADYFIQVHIKTITTTGNSIALSVFKFNGSTLVAATISSI